MLEDRVHALLKSEIDNDRFWAKRSCCKIFRRKGYFSRDRQNEIVFDISIEIYLPEAEEYSVLVVIECKNYEHRVPVDDIEEFFAKLQQISGANIKGVVAATGAFQKGARDYARSKGIAFLRYFDRRNYKWELRRSPSAAASSIHAEDLFTIDRALSDPDFVSTFFDLFAQSPYRPTSSLWELMEDILVDSGMDREKIAQIENSRNRQSTIVPFIEKDTIEAAALDVHAAVTYVDGEVRLDLVCDNERRRSGLRVVNAHTKARPSGIEVLGCITFDPLEISLFEQAEPNRGRERFTLAHELGHYFLGHGAYMTGEFCEESDLVTQTNQAVLASDVRRMEWQANYFASCFLMPRQNIYIDARDLLQGLQLKDRGFGALYVDNQSCNLKNYVLVTGVLMNKYVVSRTAITHRLEELGLLVDGRASQGLQPILGGDLQLPL